MMIAKRISLLLFCLVLFSCDNKKEQDLLAREQALQQREEQFSKKEADYQSLVKMRDSLFAVTVKDTLPEFTTWPDSLQGAWSSKMVCRESNCSNYVIGDQRNEVWEFVSDSTGTYARVLNKNKLTRVFKGQYNEAKIMLDFVADSTARNNVKIAVLLDDLKKNVMKGTQTITGQDNCKATFSVELTPSPKK
jgi:hypothetical protein